MEKKRMKRVKWTGLVLALLMVSSMLFPGMRGRAEEDLQEHFSYYSSLKALLVGDPNTGKVLLEKDGETPAGIASMTKLMTYYLVKKDIREGKYSLSTEATISPTAAAFNTAGSSNYGLKAGEKISLENLLKGMMVVSGNDAAIALAEHAGGGSEAGFVQRMNREAKNLGMAHTQFINANGFTVQGKYNVSTAKDMFLLASAIVREFPEVEEYSKLQILDEPERNFKKPSTISESVPGIKGLKGLKTGFTQEAGYCFTGYYSIQSSTKGESFPVISVMMGAPTKEARKRTTMEIVDFVSGSFAPHLIVDEEKPISRYSLPNGEPDSVVLYPKESYRTISYADQQFSVNYELQKGIQAPVKEGQVMGTIHISQDGKELKKIDIVSHQAVEASGLFTRLWRATQNLFTFLFGLAF